MTTAREDGTILLEAALVIVILCALGYAALWFGNVTLTNQQLEKAVHATARYAARSEYAPGDGAVRRRTAAEIDSYLTQAAAPDSVTTVTIECGSGPDEASMTINPCMHPENQASGTYIEVRATYTFQSADLGTSLASLVNNLFGVIHVGAPLPTQVTVRAASVALVE